MIVLLKIRSWYRINGIGILDTQSIATLQIGDLRSMCYIIRTAVRICR